jgi:predicted nucleic acid-binding OB-fold protein
MELEVQAVVLHLLPQQVAVQAEIQHRKRTVAQAVVVSVMVVHLLAQVTLEVIHLQKVTTVLVITILVGVAAAEAVVLALLVVQDQVMVHQAVK